MGIKAKAKKDKANGSVNGFDGLGVIRALTFIQMIPHCMLGITLYIYLKVTHGNPPNKFGNWKYIGKQITAKYSPHSLFTLQDCSNPKVHKQDLNQV